MNIRVTATQPDGTSHTRHFVDGPIYVTDTPIEMKARAQADAYIKARKEAGCTIEEKVG